MTIHIKLNSGRIIDAFDISGSYFITHENISNNDFDHGELQHVEISGEISRESSNLDGENENNSISYNETLTSPKVSKILKHGDDFMFSFYQPSKEQLRLEKINANLEYLAMMQDINLED